MDGLCGGRDASGATNALNGRKTRVASPIIVCVVVLVEAGGFEEEPCGLAIGIVGKSDEYGATTGYVVVCAAGNSMLLLHQLRNICST
jgi:hypothetical protein